MFWRNILSPLAWIFATTQIFTAMKIKKSHKFTYSKPISFRYILFSHSGLSVFSHQVFKPEFHMKFLHMHDTGSMNLLLDFISDTVHFTN
jgi:hypothetical protein